MKLETTSEVVLNLLSWVMRYAVKLWTATLCIALSQRYQCILGAPP